MFRPHSLASLAPFGRVNGVRLRRTLTAYGTAEPPFGGCAGETPAPPAAAPSNSAISGFGPEVQ
jgi:hypothetical protein